MNFLLSTSLTYPITKFRMYYGQSQDISGIARSSSPDSGRNISLFHCIQTGYKALLTNG
jgi:hypothetical protein